MGDDLVIRLHILQNAFLCRAVLNKDANRLRFTCIDIYIYIYINIFLEVGDIFVDTNVLGISDGHVRRKGKHQKNVKEVWGIASHE